jgi:hypothetical protein
MNKDAKQPQNDNELTLDEGKITIGYVLPDGGIEINIKDPICILRPATSDDVVINTNMREWMYLGTLALAYKKLFR